MKLTLEQKEARYRWLRSQQKWHERRNGKWHLSQYRWYRHRASRVFSLSDIVLRTMRARMPELVANITATNALLERMKK